MNEESKVISISPPQSFPDQQSSKELRSNARLLRLQGILCVELDYSGRFGFGTWVHASVLNGSETEQPWPGDPHLVTWCKDYFAQPLARRFPKWSQAEGSCGMFTWLLSENRVVHSHFPGFCLRQTITYEE